MCSRRLALLSSTSPVAALMDVAMWLCACKLDMGYSSSTSGICWTYERTRSVGSLTRLALYASFGQCW